MIKCDFCNENVDPLQIVDVPSLTVFGTSLSLRVVLSYFENKQDLIKDFISLIDGKNHICYNCVNILTDKYNEEVILKENKLAELDRFKKRFEFLQQKNEWEKIKRENG